MEEIKETNKQMVKEDWHKEDQMFNNDLFTIAHNANFGLRRDARSEQFLFLWTFLSCIIGLSFQ